jgi:glycosyltransferase involved in cell wall biosynthesis
MTANVPAPVRERLVDGGWRLADPLEITRDPWTYQNYLRASRAEFGIAKHGYVSTQCGWFSDRSSAYLATGRPAIVQDTGFSDFLPCGEGLLAYRTPDEAVAAIRRLHDNDYEAHCSAARAVAEEYFDASRVLNDLLERSL